MQPPISSSDEARDWLRRAHADLRIARLALNAPATAGKRGAIAQRGMDANKITHPCLGCGRGGIRQTALIGPSRSCWRRRGCGAWPGASEPSGRSATLWAGNR